MSEETAPATEAPETTTTPTDSTAEAEQVIQSSGKLSAALRLLNDREASIRARQEQFAEKEKLATEYSELKALSQDNPQEALRRLDLSLDKIEDLRTQESDPFQSVRQEIEQLREQVKAAQEREEAVARDNVYAEVRSAVGEHIDTSQEYPLISAAGDEAKDLVFQHILTTHQNEGKAVSEAEAAREVEAKLTELAEKLVPAYQAKNKLTANGAVTNTLTNNLAGQAPTNATYKDLQGEDAFQLLVNRINSMKG